MKGHAAIQLPRFVSFILLFGLALVSAPGIALTNAASPAADTQPEHLVSWQFPLPLFESPPVYHPGPATASQSPVNSQNDAVTQAGPVVLAIVLQTTTVNVGDTFDIDVEVRAGTQQVDSVGAYLDFNPTVLQVAKSITPGPVTLADLPNVFANSPGDVNGQADFAAGVDFLNPTYPSGTFILATFTFTATAQSAGTPISFQLADPLRQSIATFGGSSVLDHTENGTVIVQGPTATPTQTATSTPTSTPTSTSSPTSTSTPSATPTPTASSTPTNTPTNTPTPTQTSTPTITATPTASSTPTNTPTNTPTPTQTNTPTVTPTPTASSTPTSTDTPTNTPTITQTPTPSNTPTVTPTPTASNTPTITPTPANPHPWITSLNPSSAPRGGGSFSLIVNGANFVGGSVVRWNGADRPTTFLNSGKLVAVIPASDIAIAGNAIVTVFNPPPGGGTSNARTFTVQDRTPTPTPTNTPTPTSTPTATPTDAPTSTATGTLDPTHTPTATPTHTPMATHTATPLPTATPTTTSTPTPTDTPTSIPTATATATPSATPTRTTTPTVQPSTCQISGTVSLQGRTNQEGITIQIDGTPMAATAGDGGFTIENVSAGPHTVTASHAGYLPGENDSVPCQAGQTTEMPDMILLGGDADNNGEINLFDLVIVAAAYRSCAGDLNFDPRADINETGCVDIFDLVLVAANFRAVGSGDWSEAPATAPNTSAVSVEWGEGQASNQPSAQQSSEWERWSVQVSGVQNMYGVDITLTFDPQVLRVIDAQASRPGIQVMPGSLFEGRPHIIADNRVTVDQTTGIGTITFAATLLAPAEAISGGGAVVVILFEPLGSPADPRPAFTIRDVLTVDRQGHRLAAKWQGNTIHQISPIHLP